MNHNLFGFNVLQRRETVPIQYSILTLQREINKVQKEVDRKINVINMDQRDFRNRVKKRDPFISTVLEQKHIKIV